MSEAPAAPQLSGRMFLFEQPELLTKETHGDLGMQAPAQPFGFAAKARAIPITIGEIPTAMKDYPLIFMSQEHPQLLAITGLYDDINLFVDENGQWNDFRYIPGYVRRYPFGMAAETNGDRMAVVIDRGYEGFSPNAERRLFNDGEMTEDTLAAIEFVKNYERDRMMTDQFAKMLKDYGLLQDQTAQFTPSGATEQVTFAQYVGIDETRLKELPEDKFLDMQRKGLMALAYAILMSMGNWRMLLQRRAKRFNLSGDELFKPMLSQ